MKVFLLNSFVAMVMASSLSSCDAIMGKFGYVPDNRSDANTTPKSNDYSLDISVQEPKESQEEINKRKYRDDIANYLEFTVDYYKRVKVYNKTDYTIESVVVDCNVSQYPNYKGNMGEKERVKISYIPGKSSVVSDDASVPIEGPVRIVSISCRALGL